MDYPWLQSIADLVQWVAFATTAFLYAWFALKFLVILREPRKSPLHFKLTLALTLTSFLAAAFLFPFLCTAALGVNDAFSWKVDFNSSFLVYMLGFILGVAVGVVQERGFRAGIRVLLGLGYFNVLMVIYVLLSIGRVIKGTVVLPNDLVALVTLPVLVVLDIFAFQLNSGVAGAGGEEEIVDAA